MYIRVGHALYMYIFLGRRCVEGVMCGGAIEVQSSCVSGFVFLQRKRLEECSQQNHHNSDHYYDCLWKQIL